MSPKSKAALIFKNRQGQSLIESLVLSMALVTVLSGLGGLVYFGFVHIGMNYLLHEYLVCGITIGESQCRKDFLKRAGPFLFSSQIQSFESSELFGKRRVRLILLMPFKMKMTLKKDWTMKR